ELCAARRLGLQARRAPDRKEKPKAASIVLRIAERVSHPQESSTPKTSRLWIHENASLVRAQSYSIAEVDSHSATFGYVVLGHPGNIEPAIWDALISVRDFHFIQRLLRIQLHQDSS